MAYFLLADDSKPKSGFLKHLIKKGNLNLEILEAKTTEEAKELIDENDMIVCAFIDYEIPSENGPAVIAYLRKKQPTARIALVTAYDNEAYEKEARDAGAQAFVCTSMPEDEVIQTITDLLTVWKAEL